MFFQVCAQSVFYKTMNPQCVHTSVVALWEHSSGYKFITYCSSMSFPRLLLSVFCVICDKQALWWKDQWEGPACWKDCAFSCPTSQSKDRGQMVAYISESTSLDGPSWMWPSRKSGGKEQPVECHDNKYASVLNQDRTQVELGNTVNQVGEEPSSKFLTGIAITFVQFEVSHLQ